MDTEDEKVEAPAEEAAADTEATETDVEEETEADAEESTEAEATV